MGLCVSLIFEEGVIRWEDDVVSFHVAKINLTQILYRYSTYCMIEVICFDGDIIVCISTCTTIIFFEIKGCLFTMCENNFQKRTVANVAWPLEIVLSFF